MNKSTRKRLLDQHGRNVAAPHDRPVANRHGGAKATFGGSLSFDSGSPSRVSVKELEAYFDEAWRMIGSDGNSWDE